MEDYQGDLIACDRHILILNRIYHVKIFVFFFFEEILDR